MVVAHTCDGTMSCNDTGKDHPCSDAEVVIGPFRFQLPSSRDAEDAAGNKASGACRDRSSSARKALANSGKKPTSSCRGVNLHARSGRWEAHIWDGHQVHLGCFESERQAAAAHDLMALRLRGPQAKLNFGATHYSDVLPAVQQLPSKELLQILRGATPKRPAPSNPAAPPSCPPAAPSSPASSVDVEPAWPSSKAQRSARTRTRSVRMPAEPARPPPGLAPAARGRKRPAPSSKAAAAAAAPGAEAAAGPSKRACTRDGARSSPGARALSPAAPLCPCPSPRQTPTPGTPSKSSSHQEPPWLPASRDQAHGSPLGATAPASPRAPPAAHDATSESTGSAAPVMGPHDRARQRLPSPHCAPAHAACAPTPHPAPGPASPEALPHHQAPALAHQHGTRCFSSSYYYPGTYHRYAPAVACHACHAHHPPAHPLAHHLHDGAHTCPGLCCHPYPHPHHNSSTSCYHTAHPATPNPTLLPSSSSSSSCTASANPPGTPSVGAYGQHPRPLDCAGANLHPALSHSQGAPTTHPPPYPTGGFDPCSPYPASAPAEAFHHPLDVFEGYPPSVLDSPKRQSSSTPFSAGPSAAPVPAWEPNPPPHYPHHHHPHPTSAPYTACQDRQCPSCSHCLRNYLPTIVSASNLQQLTLPPAPIPDPAAPCPGLYPGIFHPAAARHHSRPHELCRPALDSPAPCVDLPWDMHALGSPSLEACHSDMDEHLHLFSEAPDALQQLLEEQLPGSCWPLDDMPPPGTALATACP